jgi:hypothetical protein
MSEKVLNNKQEAEWAREKDLISRFGLSHTIIYNLRKSGEIKSVSLKLGGNKYGARLFDVNSVREFISRQSQLEGSTV